MSLGRLISGARLSGLSGTRITVRVFDLPNVLIPIPVCAGTKSAESQDQGGDCQARTTHRSTRSESQRLAKALWRRSGSSELAAQGNEGASGA